MNVMKYSVKVIMHILNIEKIDAYGNVDMEIDTYHGQSRRCEEERLETPGMLSFPEGSAGPWQRQAYDNISIRSDGKRGAPTLLTALRCRSVISIAALESNALPPSPLIAAPPKTHRRRHRLLLLLLPRSLLLKWINTRVCSNYTESMHS